MFNLYRKMCAAAGIVLCLFSAVYASSDGNGTPADPCQIRNVSDWQHLMNTSTDWSKCFIMTADIDLQGLPLTPVGSSTPYWTGVFDGDGYVIYNANMNKPTTDNVGLFGRVAAGQIRNLGLEDVNIIGRTYVGGLAAINYGTITDCDIIGKVKGNDYVGGVAGRNLGTVSGCYQQVTVSGSSNYVGGLVGDNTSVIKLSFALNQVSGSSNVGGLTGRSSGTITSCYAVGSVVGDSSAGGLVGYISGGNVNTCYSTGAVDGNTNIGGLIGYKTSGVVDTNAFWDVNTSDCNASQSAGGTGKTTAQMQEINTFLNAGWDFTTPIWKISSGNYPKLAWQTLLGDFVSPDGVDSADLAFFVQRWLRTDCAVTNNCEGADLNKDGTVNFLDFALFAENWLQQ